MSQESAYKSKSLWKQCSVLRHCSQSSGSSEALGMLGGVVSFHKGSSKGALMCLMIMLVSFRGP